MTESKPIVAIMYDFDKTLSTTDMQNYSFIPNIGLTSEEFWNRTAEFSEKEGVERILSYMYMMIAEAKKKKIKITRKFLNKCGKNIEYYPGVESWFKRINNYGKRRGVEVEHYLVSSGTKEIIEGCSIYNNFTQVYGCEYLYNEKGEAIWPKLAINFTQKTQFFFRIAKGATKATDDNGVNDKTLQLRVPYRNILYLGDGMTDIACMTLVKKNNGRSIAVYPEGNYDKVQKILSDGRCNFICPANYNKNSEMEQYVKLFIDSCAINEKIVRKQLKRGTPQTKE